MTVIVTIFSEVFYIIISISFSASRWFLKGYSNPVEFSYKNESQSIRKVGKKLRSNINIRIIPNLLMPLLEQTPKGSRTFCPFY